MKRTIQLGTGLAIFLLIACSIRADVPPFFHPRRPFDSQFVSPSPPKKVPVQIETSPTGPQARLVIPRRFLANSTKWATSQRPVRSLIVLGKHGLSWGTGLALGFVLLPVGLGRVKGRRLAVAFGLALTITGTLFLSQSSQAHMCPPPILPFKLTGQVTVDVVDEGDAIRLIFNRNEAFKRS